MKTVTVLEPDDLIAWRKKHYFSLYEACWRFGISQTQWWKLEHGRAEIPRHFYDRMLELDAELETKAVLHERAEARRKADAPAAAERVRASFDASFERDKTQKAKAQRLAEMKEELARLNALPDEAVEDKAIDGLDVKAFLSAME